MTTTWYWNPDFIVLNRNDKEMILKNDNNGALISLSEAEYELLQAYSCNNEYEHVRTKMRGYQMERTLYDAIVDKACALKILIREKEKNRKRRLTQFKMKLYYLGNILVRLLEFITRRPITAEYSGNMRFFKLFSVDLAGSLIQKTALHSCTGKIFFPLYGLLCLFLILCPILIPEARFSFSGFGIEHIPIFKLFICLILCIFTCLFFHEMGHYFVYKHYQGEGDKIGLGTMFIVFPVLYTQINQVSMWKNRKQKLLLSAAGVMMDFLLLLVLINVLSFYHAPNLFSLITACLFYYYLVQILTNLNFLSPGTDGYYLFEDLFKIDRLYGNAYETSKAFWKEIKRWQIPHKTAKEILQIIYFCLSCLSITGYWLLITLLLTFPIWSNTFLS